MSGVRISVLTHRLTHHHRVANLSLFMIVLTRKLKNRNIRFYCQTSNPSPSSKSQIQVQSLKMINWKRNACIDCFLVTKWHIQFNYLEVLSVRELTDHKGLCRDSLSSDWLLVSVLPSDWPTRCPTSLGRLAPCGQIGRGFSSDGLFMGRGISAESQTENTVTDTFTGHTVQKRKQYF